MRSRYCVCSSILPSIAVYARAGRWGMSSKAVLAPIVVTALSMSLVGCDLPARTEPQPAQPAAPPTTVNRTPARRSSPASAVISPVETVDPPPTTQMPESACGLSGALPRRLTIQRAGTPIFIQPRALPVPLATLPSGSIIPVSGRENEWYFIRFEDRQWGTRVGYVYCDNVSVTPGVEPEPVFSTSASPVSKLPTGASSNEPGR